MVDNRDYLVEYQINKLGIIINGTSIVSTSTENYVSEVVQKISAIHKCRTDEIDIISLVPYNRE